MANTKIILTSLSNKKVTLESQMQSAKAVMEAADIAGISVATVDSQGKITSVSQGTINSTRCGLLQRSTAPTEEQYNNFAKSFYIFTGTDLFYYNKSKNMLRKIDLDGSQLKQFSDSFKDKNIDLLSDKELGEITRITNHVHSSPSDDVTVETIFGAASLSKPVFAYLVLKLIEANNLDTAKPGLVKFSKKFNLHTPLHEVYPQLLFKFSAHDQDKAKKITAKMVLSHTTGLPIMYNEYKFALITETEERVPLKIYINTTKDGLEYEVIGIDGKLKKDTISWKELPDIPRTATELIQSEAQRKFVTTLLELTSKKGFTTGPIRFQFEPGTKYAYSGPGIAYLQETIEAVTNSDLETLAQENVFGKQALNMANSTYVGEKDKPPQAANSLCTTPSDYAKLISSWINDQGLKKLFDAFEPLVTMTDAELPDNWIIKGAKDIKLEDKESVAWGLGMGLEIKNNKVIAAYHTGDMNEWRTWVAINLEDSSAIVYFSNSHNGHILAEQIISPHVPLNHAFNYFFQTYGFARNLEELHGVTNFDGVNPTLFIPPQPPQDKNNQTKQYEVNAFEEQREQDTKHSTKH